MSLLVRRLLCVPLGAWLIYGGWISLRWPTTVEATGYVFGAVTLLLLGAACLGWAVRAR